MTLYKKQKIKREGKPIAFYQLLTIIGISTYLFSANVYAATEQQLKIIKQAAEALIRQKIEIPDNGSLIVEATRIDSRIYATNCSNQLQTSLASKINPSGNTSVLVECPIDNWKVYVPVKAELMMPLITSITSLAKGHMITSSDLNQTLVNSRIYRRGGFVNLDELVGSRVKRSVRAGNIISKSDICMVCRNDSVIIKAEKGELAILTKGTSLGDGAIGDRVSVKNDKSKRVISGIVTDIGEINVRF